MDIKAKHIVLAITGGSGAPIASRLLKWLSQMPHVRVSLIVSDHAKEVFKAESQIDLGTTSNDLRESLQHYFNLNEHFELLDFKDMAAKVSSGSNPTDAMIVAPCSMSTLGAIAHGITMNLIHRAASVMLKEKRPLILVPRESPLSPIHLSNMLELSRIGVHIAPATTAFYYNPKSIQDMVDFVCMKVFDLAGLQHPIDKRWKGDMDNTYGSHQRVHEYLG